MLQENVTLKITSVPTITLSMIVKNESKIICRFLDSVKTLIDYACICDTGSTDDTIDVINNYFEKNKMRGKVITKEFVNFQENRNYALNEAKKHGDYVLLLDADMKLVNSDKIVKSKLNGAGYMLLQKGGSLSYYNLRLIPSSLHSEYIGVTHEYLSFDGPMNKMEDVYINDVGDGGCKSDKFIRDEKLLKQGLQDDPGNSRYMFYLANTLRDLSKYVEAIEYYKQRINAGGWEEEVFYSQYQIGLCFERMGEHYENNMETAYMNAWALRPTRAEPLYDLAHYFRLKSNNVKSWGYAMIGKDIPQPDDKLFVHTDKYGIAFNKELSIVSYYVPVAKKEHSLFNEIFKHDTSPGDIANYMFYCKQFIADNIYDFSCTHTADLFDQNMIYYGSSPCIIPFDNGYKMNIRLVNYKIQPDGSYLVGDVISTTNKLVTLDNQFNKVGDETMVTMDISGIADGMNHRLHGVEDIRIAEYGGKTIFTGTICNSKSKIGMAMGEYKNNPDIVELDMLSSCEKNWVLVPGRDKMEIVYSWNPLCVKEVDPETGHIKDLYTKSMPSIFNHVRGSTNGIIHDKYIYFYSHLVLHGNPRKYIGIISKFDMKMNYIGCSYPFKLSQSSIEYCLGMIIEDERIVFSYSENDGSSKIAVINKERFFNDFWMN